MDPETVLWVIGGIVAVLTGGGGLGAALRMRNGKAPEQTQAQARQVIHTYPEAPPPDFAADTGRHAAMTDTQRNLVSPLAMFDAINRVENKLTALYDGSNGHGVVRRQEFGRLETKVDRVDDKVDRISEQVAAMRATCEARMAALTRRRKDD